MLEDLSLRRAGNGAFRVTEVALASQTLSRSFYAHIRCLGCLGFYNVLMRLSINYL